MYKKTNFAPFDGLRVKTDVLPVDAGLFVMRKQVDNRPPKEERTLKRGDTREDGQIFWTYGAQSKGGVMWLSEEKFKKKLALESSRKTDHRPNPEDRVLRRGDTRSDGMLFWAYNATHKNGERWATLGDFDKLKARHCELKATSAKKNRETQRKWRRKQEENPAWKISMNVRRRVHACIKHQHGLRQGRTRELLGCSADELRLHLQSQFKDGMTWENYGLYGWHIDHILPCNSFDLTLDSEQRKCFHYTNMQPLWAKENLAKGDKIL